MGILGWILDSIVRNINRFIIVYYINIIVRLLLNIFLPNSRIFKCIYILGYILTVLYVLYVFGCLKCVMCFTHIEYFLDKRFCRSVFTYP